MAKEARSRTRAAEDQEPGGELPEEAGVEAPAEETTDKPDDGEVPLSAGKGGRYTMINGRRVKRTD